MVDPIELTSGDELAYEMTTVYQDEDADPYTGTRTVSMVVEEEGCVIVTFAALYEDGFPTRRWVVPTGDDEDAEPVYEAVRGEPSDDPVWVKMSDDFQFEWTDCGYEKDDGTECGLCAGWGTDHTGEGRCKHHEGVVDTSANDDTEAVSAD